MGEEGARHGTRRLEYDAIILGEEIGPLEIVVDEQRVRNFAYAVDDFNPWYLWDSPFGGPVAPPSLLSRDDPEFAIVWGRKYDQASDRALAAKFELRSLEPIKVGQRVLLRASYVDRYVKRGKGYVVRELEVRAVDGGRRLAWSRTVEMMEMRPGVEVGAGTETEIREGRVSVQASELPSVSRARADTPIGSPLVALTKQVSRKQMFVFSARPGWWTNIHTDAEFAKTVGLSDSVAQGLMTCAYISELCVRFFGASWFSGGWMSVAFLKPVCAEDTLRVGGSVTAILPEATGTDLQLDVWCVNQHGQLTTAGRARASVP